MRNAIHSYPLVTAIALGAAMFMLLAGTGLLLQAALG